MKHFHLLFTLVLAVLFFGCSSNKSKPNILFISIDDLKPELGIFGEDHISSPNIDQLAQDAVRFNRAYCNVPICGASRASIMTGVYPTPTRFVTYYARADEEADQYPTLPETLKDNGYFTTTLGKIFHFPDDSVEGWSELPYRPDFPNRIDQQELWRDYQSEELAWTKTQNLPQGVAGPAWEAADVADSIYYDGKTTQLALKKLEQLKNLDKPFFFGLGYIRPHLPFNAPKKYWDLYDEDEITLATNHYMPKNAPDGAKFNFSELRSYTNIANDNNLIDEAQARKLRHGYYACVSFIDAQIGKVIHKLKELDLYDNTIIVLWGDHGFSLGEHTHWGKHTCFDQSLRVPLMIKAPDHLAGVSTQALASLIDVYPTVCALAGIEQPNHLEGKSLVPALKDRQAVVNEQIFARYVKGETVKNDRFIYTQYYKNGAKCETPTGAMLYDHANDPEENINLVDAPEHRETVNELKALLATHMQTRFELKQN